jgi:hypothetical protein
MGLEMMIDTVKTIEPGENLLDLIATSIIPFFLLFGSPGPEVLQRRNRGLKEEKPGRKRHSPQINCCLSRVFGSAVPFCQVFSGRKC